jgi:hypothetical protein
MASKKPAAKWLLDDDDESSDETRALLGYVPFGESPKRASKLPAPVSGSVQKQPRYSQDSLSDIEVLGFASAPKDYDFEFFENKKAQKAAQPKPQLTECETDDDDFFEERKPSKKVKDKKLVKQELKTSRKLRDEEKDELADNDDDDQFEDVHAKSKKLKVSSSSSVNQEKKKRVGKMTTPELLDSFEYHLPLGVKRLPSLRAFNNPFCSCTFWDGQVRMVVKPSKYPEITSKTILLKNGAMKTIVQYGKPVPREQGGSLRSWRCPGWTMTLNGDKKIFGRKEGYSSGSSCRSVAIDEIKDFTVRNGERIITEVGLSDYAVEYFNSPGARISEKR